VKKLVCQRIVNYFGFWFYPLCRLY